LVWHAFMQFEVENTLHTCKKKKRSGVKRRLQANIAERLYWRQRRAGALVREGNSVEAAEAKWKHGRRELS